MARLIGIVTIIGIALACVLAEDLYSDRYDDVDVLAIFNNEKLRDQYHQCFMSTGPCKTPDAKFFKDLFRDALRNQCKRCTEKQKQIIETTVEWYSTNRPDLWEQMLAKVIKAKERMRAGQ